MTEPDPEIERLKAALATERAARLAAEVSEDLEASATEDELKAEMAAALRSGWPALIADRETTDVKAFTRNKPSRKPFPEHLPRERVVIPGPTSCDCCGSDRLAKFGDDITETLEVIPRQWKVIQYIREKVTCRPKIGSLGTDLVGACTMVLRPLVNLIEAHGLNADRLHADDTPIRRRCSSLRTVPRTVRDRPSLHSSRNRKGEHPTRHLADFAGVLQADADSGFNPLLDPKQKPGPITLFELAELGDDARGGQTDRRLVRHRTRKPGSPTSSLASQNIPPKSSSSFCLGIARLNSKKNCVSTPPTRRLRSPRLFSISYCSMNAVTAGLNDELAFFFSM